jgi:hypothetical protein
MILINNVGAEARQELRIDYKGSDVIINLDYYPSLQKWFFNIEYKSFKRTGLQLSLNTSLLSSYSNLLPFTLACLPNPNNILDKVDPFLCDIDNQANDFTLERVLLYVVSNDELQELNDTFYSLYQIV